MKRKKIGLMSDSAINYKRILALNDVVHLEQVKNGFDLFILDITDFDESSNQLSGLRSINQTTPVIWVIDPVNSLKALNELKGIMGMGRIRIEYRNADDPQAILQSVAVMTYPDLPTKRMSMDLFIPVFNEAHRMDHVSSFAKKLQMLHSLGYPYITIYFIDDGSDDNSNAFLEDMIDAYYENSDHVEFKAAFRILKLDHNTRKAGTYMEAFRAATSDIIIFADADDAFNLDDISKLVNIVEQGFYDMVIGTKDKTAENRPFIRDLVSTVKRFLTKPLLPKGVTDSQTGLKMFRGQTVKPILSELDEKYGLAIDLKIIHVAKKMNLRVLEVPVHFDDRDGSHIDVVRDSFRFIKNMVKISLGM